MLRLFRACLYVFGVELFLSSFFLKILALIRQQRLVTRSSCILSRFEESTGSIGSSKGPEGFRTGSKGLEGLGAEGSGSLEGPGVGSSGGLEGFRASRVVDSEGPISSIFDRSNDTFS